MQHVDARERNGLQCINITVLCREPRAAIAHAKHEQQGIRPTQVALNKHKTSKPCTCSAGSGSAGTAASRKQQAARSKPLLAVALSITYGCSKSSGSSVLISKSKGIPKTQMRMVQCSGAPRSSRTRSLLSGVRTLHRYSASSCNDGRLAPLRPECKASIPSGVSKPRF